MVKLKRFFYILGFILVVNISPTAKTLDSFFEPVVCQAMTYDDFKAKVSKITSGAKNFWADSAADRAKLAKKPKRNGPFCRKKSPSSTKRQRSRAQRGSGNLKNGAGNRKGNFGNGIMIRFLNLCFDLTLSTLLC